MIPRGATLDAVCRPCAERARSLRAEQCRDGWHLDTEPDPMLSLPGESQEFWLTTRARAQALRDRAAANDEDTCELDHVTAEHDAELANSGIRGSLGRRTNANDIDRPARGRRVRSTRRRQDAPALPRARTTGRAFTSPDGKTYRPSMFLTLTCDSYGKVGEDGTPADPASYDYQRAARDAIHFPLTGPENLGYAGRRVLVSRKWSGKTLDDHRADRKAWLMARLDLPADESD